MSAPQKGTPEHDLWVAAIDVAVTAPLRKGEYVHAALVPWSLINDLRSSLDALGIDWRKVKRNIGERSR